MTRDYAFAAALGLAFVAVGALGVVRPARMRWLGVWWLRLLWPRADAVVVRLISGLFGALGLLILGSVVRHFL